jgi:STE24 endopeptidase
LAFDAASATAAYIDALGPEVLAKSAAYTAGRHWLLLWGLVVSIVVAWLIVRSGALRAIERRLARRGANLRAFAVSAAYFVLAGLLTLPWATYERWWRERSYGRTSQPLGDALGQALIGIGLSALLGGLFFTGVYALIRRTQRRWWAWSALLAAAGITFVLLIAPVVIEPMFNEYRPVPEGPVRDAVVALADKAGIPHDRLFVYDGSRQSNNFTANVSGIGPFARIAISDVALKGASLDEVRAVTGHEIGHYVLRHVWYSIGLLSALAIAAFFVADRIYPRVARALGSDAPLASPTSLPVVVVIASVLGFVTSPAINALSRMNESQADRYSLEVAGLPDAIASALVKTAEYRYPRPTPLQEALFYTHPSVERRIRAAMEWKAAHGAR